MLFYMPSYFLLFEVAFIVHKNKTLYIANEVHIVILRGMWWLVYT